MGRFTNDETGVTVSVDDSKDHRFTAGWSPAADESKKAPAKKAASSSKTSK